MAKSTVYFTKEITPEAVLKMYRQLGVELPGKVAVKVHSGEDGNQNFLRPEFMKPVIDAVHGTVVECNTAYGGARNETPKHVQLMKKHGWSDLSSTAPTLAVTTLWSASTAATAPTPSRPPRPWALAPPSMSW